MILMVPKRFLVALMGVTSVWFAHHRHVLRPDDRFKNAWNWNSTYTNPHTLWDVGISPQTHAAAASQSASATHLTPDRRPFQKLASRNQKILAGWASNCVISRRHIRNIRWTNLSNRYIDHHHQGLIILNPQFVALKCPTPLPLPIRKTGEATALSRRKTPEFKLKYDMFSWSLNLSEFPYKLWCSFKGCHRHQGPRIRRLLFEARTAHGHFRERLWKAIPHSRRGDPSYSCGQRCFGSC